MTWSAAFRKAVLMGVPLAGVVILARRFSGTSFTTSPRLKLVIGDRAYSSWSLRAWLVLKRAALAQGSGEGFQEISVELAGAGNDANKEALKRYSPTGKVPALYDGDLGFTVWDSLAIAEYCSELYPKAGLWPKHPRARAVARSAAAEMHSGFSALRGAMPMNTRRHLPGEGMKDGVQTDITRIMELWDECRTVAKVCGCKGDFLFGDFSIADAMFAPVVLRFRTYEPPLTPSAEAYCSTILAMPEIQEWCEEAAVEAHRIEQYEK